MYNKIILFVLFVSLFLINKLYSKENENLDTLAKKSYSSEGLVIMAPKDAMLLKVLPSSITLIESQTLLDNGVTSLRDLTSIAPNFFMPDYGSKLTSPVYIRGIGSRINSPSVGLNVDYVPYFEKASFDFDLFGIERVEILRGPQGTLYGRNTMGGIINVFTKSPLKHEGTEAFVNAGNYGFFNAGVNHYGSLRKTFGYSIGMNYLNEDGFFENNFTGKKSDAMQSIGSRIRLIHQPNDYFSFENISSFERSKQDGYPYAKINLKDNSVENVNYNQPSYYDRDLFSNAFVMKVDNENFEIISTTSFQLLNDINAIDQDFTKDSLYFVTQWQDHKMFSQELITKSKYNEAYEWLFGIYGFYQNFNNKVDVEYYKAKSLTVKEYFHDIYGGAVFHQSTLNNFIFKNLSVIGGIRFDYELDAMDYVASSTVNNIYKPVADTTYNPLSSFEIMPKFALKYELNLYTSFYSTLSRGYKTGGFNTTFERPEDVTFDPEQSWNYEFGFKLNLFDGLLYTDFAVFYIDWQNQQIYQPVPSGRGSMLKNAGESTSQGLEFSLNALPFNDFEANISFGFTDARFKSHVVDSSKNYSGNYIPYVPELTFSAQASYMIHFNSELIKGIRLNSQFRYVGKHYWNERNIGHQDAYGLLDANITIQTSYFNLDVWAKNIFDVQYSAFYFEALGNSFVQQGRPARIGVRVSTTF